MTSLYSMVSVYKLIHLKEITIFRIPEVRTRFPTIPEVLLTLPPRIDLWTLYSLYLFLFAVCIHSLDLRFPAVRSDLSNSTLMMGRTNIQRHGSKYTFHGRGQK